MSAFPPPWAPGPWFPPAPPDLPPSSVAFKVLRRAVFPAVAASLTLAPFVFSLSHAARVNNMVLGFLFAAPLLARAVARGLPTPHRGATFATTGLCSAAYGFILLVGINATTRGFSIPFVALPPIAAMLASALLWRDAPDFPDQDPSLLAPARLSSIALFVAAEAIFVAECAAARALEAPNLLDDVAALAGLVGVMWLFTRELADDHRRRTPRLREALLSASSLALLAVLLWWQLQVPPAWGG